MIYRFLLIMIDKGEVNDHDKFNDYYIEDYNDLCEYS